MKQRSAQIVTDPTIVLISRRGQNSQISGVHETDERTGKVEYIYISPETRGRNKILHAHARAIFHMSPRALARGGHIFV